MRYVARLGFVFLLLLGLQVAVLAAQTETEIVLTVHVQGCLGPPSCEEPTPEQLLIFGSDLCAPLLEGPDPFQCDDITTAPLVYLYCPYCEGEYPTLLGAGPAQLLHSSPTLIVAEIPDDLVVGGLIPGTYLVEVDVRGFPLGVKSRVAKKKALASFPVTVFPTTE